MPKMFMPIASAFAPNYKLKDFLIASQELVLPWNRKNWQEGKQIEELEKRFAEYMDCPRSISFDSGRSGFYAILKALEIGEGDEVILQAFTTVALANMIQLLGAKPVYVDIERETYNINPAKIEEKITAKTKAIITQHTFGNPAKIEEILEIAQKHNLKTIEDCAHSLGAEYKGQKTGKFSDAAFFSFGRDKVISSVTGGMVIAREVALQEKIREIQNGLDFPNKKEIAKSLLHPIITMKALFTYNLFSLGKIIMFTALRFGMINRAYSKSEKEGKSDIENIRKMPNALAKIALHQIICIEKFNKHRIKIANLYSKNIKNDKIALPITNTDNRNIYLWYTIITENKKSLIRKAEKKNIILGDWFPQAIGPKEVDLTKAGYQKGDCPVAEEISRKCVNLPTHHNIGKKQAGEVIAFINRF